MPRTSWQDRGVVDVMVSSAARTTSGTSTGLVVGSAEQVRAQLNVTAASGTTPTLDVTLEDSVDNGVTWNTIATFPQETTVDRAVINLSAPFTNLIRVRWVIAGTTPSFTFAVHVYSQ